MKRNRKTTILTVMLVFTIPIGIVVAEGFDIDWYTVDGGGVMHSSGGDFELSGTIGQPDPGELSGEPFTLTGGFWSAPPCWCMSDMNNDGLRNGEDVQGFIDCMFSSGSNCACADVETGGSLDMDDVALFVDGLLAGEPCP